MNKSTPRDVAVFGIGFATMPVVFAFVLNDVEAVLFVLSLTLRQWMNLRP